MFVTVMRIIAAVILGSVLLIACTVTLYAIVRYSIISSWRTRGEEGRLRVPDLDGIKEQFGVELPQCLADHYRTSPWIERAHFQVVRYGERPEAHLWCIGAFIPLAVPDIREWLGITGVDGIPIATTEGKGIYFVPSAPPPGEDRHPVLLSRPGEKEAEIVRVADSIDEFFAFVPAEYVD